MNKIIIVGAGFAGLQAAKGLTTSSFDVTIIDKNNYHLFQPLLYQVATAGLSPADIAVPIRNIFRSQQNPKVILDELIGINPQLNQIKTRNNTYIYDFLVIATGSEPSYFGHDQWKNFSYGLKNIKDATSMRTKILKAFEKAERIKNEAANRGSSMHSYIEQFLLGKFNLDLLNEDNKSKKMAIPTVTVLSLWR